MSKYSFEPDFKKWWCKKSLSMEDLSILVFGLNPDQFKKYLDVGNRERNEEERNFLQSYHDYVSSQKQHSDIYRINDMRLHLLKQGYGKKGKESFVKSVYEDGLEYLGEEISEKFVSYLSSIGEMPNHFDKYKDFSKYRADISTIKFENIKNEDEAFSYLLGLAPEYFYKFKEYTDDRRVRKKAWKDITPENRFFARQYFIFIREEYGFLDMFGEETLFRAYRHAKSLNVWDGSIVKYVQSLHDEGFIFRSNIYEKLKIKGIEPDYSDNSWAEQFYKRWIKEGLWTLDESMALFKGQNPKKGRSFHDLSQNPWMFSNNLFWENFDSEFLQIDERLKKHIAAGLLSPEKIDSKEYFYPSEIVRWMAENFTYSPPEVLLKSVFNEEENLVIGKNISKTSKEKIVPSPLTHTGSAGRPNAKVIYTQEMKRRAKEGLLSNSVKAEAIVLHNFLESQKLSIAMPTIKGIENAIRVEFKNLKKA